MSFPRRSFQEIRLLLLEDSMDLREQLSRLLGSARMGFTVETLHGSVGLSKKLLTGNYDALIVDYDLAVGDPASVVETAKGIDPFLPVMLVSREFSENIFLDHSSIGADAYIPLSGVPLKMLPNTLIKLIEDLSFVREATDFRHRSLLKSYQIEILASLVRKMVETNDLKSVMQELAEQVVRKLDMKVVSLQRYFPAQKGFAVYGIYPQGKLVKFAQMFFDISLDTFVFPFDPEHCIVDQYTADRKAWVGSDFADVFGTTMPAQAARMIQKFAGVKSIYNAPFYSKDQLLGGIVVGNVREKFTDEELEAFDAIVHTSSLLFEYNEGVKSHFIQDRKLQAIRETSSQLHENLDPEKLFDIIDEKLSTIVPADVARLFIYEKQKSALVETKLRVRSGRRPSFMMTEVPLGKGLIGRAAAEKISLLENNAQANPMSVYPAERPKIEHLVAVPVTHQGQLLGLIALTRLNEEPFVESDREALEIFTSQFAIALYNSRLYQDLLRSERLYRLVLENVNDPVIFVGIGGKLLYVSPKFEEASGYTAEEVLGKDFGFLVHPDDLHFVLTRYRERISGRDTVSRYEFRFVKKSGEIRAVDYNVTTIWEDGKITGLLGVARDVTEDKIAREELKRKTQQLQRMLDFNASLMHSSNLRELLSNLLAAVKEGIPETDGGSILTFDKVEKKLKMSASIGYPDEMGEMFTLDSSEGWGGRAFATGMSVIVDDASEFPPTGSGPPPLLPKIKSAVAVPLEVDDEILGVISLDNFSVTGAFHEEHQHLLEGFAHQAALALKKEQMHSEIKESELRYRTITESSSDLIVVIDTAGRIEFCNDKFLKTFGVSWESAQGRMLIEFFDDDCRENLVSAVVPADPGKKQRATAAIDGWRHHFEVVSSSITSDKGALRHILFLNDVSDLVRTSEWIEKAYGVALAHTGIELIENYADLLAEVFNTDVVFLGDYDPSNDSSLAHVVKIGNRYLHTLEIHGVEELMEKADAKISYLGAILGGDRKINSYYATDIEVDGRRVGIIIMAGEKLLNSTRSRMNVLQLVRQRLAFEYERERNEAETHRLEEQLRHSQKMESLGTLAGGVAHDFNNILGAILGYSGLLKLELKGNRKLSRYLDTIEKSAQRAAELTKQLLGFARKGKTSVTSVNFNRICTETIDMTKKMIEKNVKVTLHLQEGLPLAEGDESQLSQVVMNLVLNARDAMPQGGSLRLSTRNLSSSDAEKSKLNLEKRNYVVVEVSDTGHGISKEDLPRIFEPFFTTKPKGKGTGLGLSMVYGIVKNHGGEVEVESETEKGTTVRVYLPVTSRPASSGTASGESENSKKVKDKVCLVVDDEVEIRDLLKDSLTLFGFDVLTAENGETAIELVKKSSKIDVVVLDMIMPGMDGSETYSQIHKLRPELPVLVATGYSAEGRVQDILNNGGVGILRKPFTLDELQNRLVDRFVN